MPFPTPQNTHWEMRFCLGCGGEGLARTVLPWPTMSPWCGNRPAARHVGLETRLSLRKNTQDSEHHMQGHGHFWGAEIWVGLGGSPGAQLCHGGSDALGTWCQVAFLHFRMIAIKGEEDVAEAGARPGLEGIRIGGTASRQGRGQVPRDHTRG